MNSAVNIAVKINSVLKPNVKEMSIKILYIREICTPPFFKMVALNPVYHHPS